MTNFPEKLDQIKTLILSASNSDKSFAYSTLLNLQEQASNDNSLIHYLLDSSLTILSSIVSDITVDDPDEEIVVLGLKCLGFMIYHPSIVARIPKQCINEVLESLARLIITTKIKVVCNLGVWCISMQQIDASSLVVHFDSLLRSVVHSLDNPFGSLSTTFEGIQAITKLGTQVSEKMRDTSSIWAQPIYRRLLSADKRERDMCQRCLLKIKCLIIPPHPALSKAIAHEMKLKLLPAMTEMMKQGKKTQVLLAWRWFICMLGYHSLKHKHLVNELLKVPEETFSDSDPQVQTATLVAWEGLIDALVPLPASVCKTVNGGIIQTGGYSKGLKLIMTPIIEIMASKTDFSVQSSCLNTWYYLLHKLDSSINDPFVLHTVVEPIFKVIFNAKLDDRNIWIWNVCMNLLHDFIRSKSLNDESRAEVTCNSSPRITNNCTSRTLKTYPVKWLSWNCSQVDFFVRMIQMILSQAAVSTLSSENNNLGCDMLLRTFRFFLKGVQINLAESSTSYDTVTQSMNAVLGLVKSFCETALSVDGVSIIFKVTCVRSLEAVIQELDPSILGSPLYKVPLDVRYVCQAEARCRTLVGSVSISFMDMVPPVIYLTVLYCYVVAQVSTNAVSHDFILPDAINYFNRVLSSYELLDILHAVSASLYVCDDNSSSSVWLIVARCLRDHLYAANDLLPLKIEPTSPGSQTVCKFFIYPLVLCSSCKLPTPGQCNTPALPTSPKKCIPEQVIDMWIALYSSVNCTVLQEFPRKNWFAEDLCAALNDFLHQQINLCEQQLLFLCVDIGKCILDNVHIEKVTPEAIKCNSFGSSGINNCFEFIASLMKLMLTKMEEGPMSVAISRLLPPLLHVVGHIQWKEDITSFTKVLGGSLLPWMSDTVLNSGHIKDELSLLWAEVIRSLQRSWPSIEFDSSFLKLQAPLLEKTLDHPNPAISQPTINFWNSAYGDQPDLEFPPCLSPLLNRLYRLGKLKLRNKQAPVLEKDNSSLQVSATLRVCSKRVELVKNGNASELPPCPKRKRTELTEHQREVKRAQQGKGRDCSGHGPGIRTYTSVDFSQGNEDSQDSQDILAPELILDLLKRAE